MKPFVWKDHANAIIQEVARFYRNGVEVDCTLIVEGRQIKGHKLILCASSLYFQKLFMVHSGRRAIPIKGVKYQDLENIFTFIYTGLVEIPVEQVSSFIKTAKLLEVAALKKYDSAEKWPEHCEKDRLECENESSKEQPFLPLSVSTSYGENQMSSDDISDYNSSNYQTTMQNETNSKGQGEDARSVNNKDTTEREVMKNRCQEIVSDVAGTNNSLSSVVHFRSEALDNVDGVKSSEKHSSIDGYQSKEWKIVNDLGFHSVFFIKSDEEKSDDNSMDSQESQSAVYTTSVDHYGSEPAASTSFRKAPAGNDKYKPVCNICSAVFSKKSNLEQHLRTHTGEKPYTCTSCPAAFAEKEALVAHEKMHTGEKLFVCTYCSETFASRGDLKEHASSHTAEDKPYLCTYCAATFSGKSNLDKHVRTHTGEKPYVCTICHAAFTQRDTLKTHLRIHTGEKPFACDACGAAFTNRSSLTNHSRTHTGEKPYACHLCPASFAIGGNLKKHVLTHSGAKPFRCDECSTPFSRRVHLQRHMLSHTGEKPFKCAKCPVAYTRKFHLVKHLLTHKENPPAADTHRESKKRNNETVLSRQLSTKKKTN